MDRIPLHSLVIVRDSEVWNKFPTHEHLSLEIVAERLYGGAYDKSRHSILIDEIYHSINKKLEMGERIIIHEMYFKDSDKKKIREIATNVGAKVLYLNHINFEVVPYSLTREWVDKFSNVMVIGDVHGNMHILKLCIEDAKKKNSFMIFVGDVVDYGRETLSVFETIYELIVQGKAEMIRGNHERKIGIWITRPSQRKYIKLSEGNKTTVNALKNLPKKIRMVWESRFMAIWNKSKNHFFLDNVVIAHGGISPKLWEDGPCNAKVEEFSMFGEFFMNDNKKEKSFGWTKDIPEGCIGIVGHTVRSLTYPVIETNAEGGTSIFLDTGCGKGGILSSVEIANDEDFYQVVQYNTYA